jgi:hypothetical protein
MSFELYQYIAFFETEEDGELQEHVLAEDVSEVIHSIKVGWPDAKMLAVYKQVWTPGDEE